MKIVIHDIFLKQILIIRKYYSIFIKICHFCLKVKKVSKVEKLICGIEYKKKYVTHIRALKQTLNNGLRLKKVHRIIQFKQKAQLKVYIDMNTELRKNAENEFEEKFFKLMNNSVFGKKYGKCKKSQGYQTNNIRISFMQKIF